MLYARYSEYVHYAFAQPRLEIEDALGHDEEQKFGSEEYFRAGQIDGAPLEALVVDAETASFTLQMCWPLLYELDPFLAKSTHDQVVKALKQQGMS